MSEELLNVAIEKYNGINISYKVGCAFGLSSFIDSTKFDKIYVQFSFQYFDKKNNGVTAIDELLKCLKPKGKIFIGDIPNSNKKYMFYDTLEKKLRYLKDRLLYKNKMGKFWSQKEFNRICSDLNVKGTFLKQPEVLPYSHYRFDYLIEN